MAEHNETVTILTYKRNSKAWLCNECETENHMEYTKCIVCGMNRQVTSRVLETWETEQAKSKATGVKPSASAPATGGWINTTERKPEPVPYYSEPKKDRSAMIAVITVIIAILVLIGVIVYLNDYYYWCY